MLGKRSTTESCPSSQARILVLPEAAKVDPFLMLLQDSEGNEGAQSSALWYLAHEVAIRVSLRL